MMSSFRPMNRSHWAAGLASALALLLVLIFSAPGASAAAANPEEAWIQQNIDKGYAILNNNALSPEQRRMQFRDYMLTLTDIRRIGVFTLGQYANGASKPELDTFVDAFLDYAVAVYESRLSKYKGQTLKVTGSAERAADDVVVNADVASPGTGSNAQPIKVAFRVRKTADGRPIITDMQVEGVWLALSQRSDFTGFLQQHGGSVAALADHLKVQAQQIHAAAANSVKAG